MPVWCVLMKGCADLMFAAILGGFAGYGLLTLAAGGGL